MGNYCFETMERVSGMTKQIYILEQHIHGEGSRILGVYNSLEKARRMAWQTKRPIYAMKQNWVQTATTHEDQRLRLACDDVSLTIREYKVQ